MANLLQHHDATVCGSPDAAPAAASPEGRWVHRCLLTGVLISGPLLVVGITLTLTRGPLATTGTNVAPPPILTLLQQAASADGPALILLGLLVLMVTPILRVATLAVVWSIRPDAKRFAFVAATVLVLLAVSIGLSFG